MQGFMTISTKEHGAKMSKTIIKNIYALANQLDQAGLFRAAAHMDAAADLIILAEQEVKKSIHVTFKREKGMVVCELTVHEMENPNAMGPAIRFVGQNVKAARSAAASKIEELKKEHSAGVVESFEGGLEP
jgi:hypothetical protein